MVGHRGLGKNKILPIGDVPEARPSVRENTITSFNLAARNGAHFVEFDVQVIITLRFCSEPFYSPYHLLESVIK